MEEAVSGVKGELPVKIYGDDLVRLRTKGNEVVQVMSKIPGVADLGLFRIIGQRILHRRGIVQRVLVMASMSPTCRMPIQTAIWWQRGHTIVARRGSV